MENQTIRLVCKSMMVAVLLFFVASCGNGGQNNTNFPTTDTVPAEDCALYDSLTNIHYDTFDPHPELTTAQYRQLVITSIANGDKETFAGLVDYPLRRTYPLRDICTRQQMIDYFDILFDDDFRKHIATMDSNDWEEVGWRGYMLDHGMIWEAPIIAINYSSPREELLRQKINEAEIGSLHPSLRGEWTAVDRLLLRDSRYGTARIDVAKCDTGEVYRIALFYRGAGVADEPALCMKGQMTISGSACIVSFFFSSEEGSIYYSPDTMADDDSSMIIELASGEHIQSAVHNHYYQPCGIRMD